MKHDLASRFLDIAPEVQSTLNSGGAVVALESTIITHGMPHPQNVATAREVEAVVRDNGAVPATIAIIEGRIKIGLSDAELDWLGTAKDVMKLSRADLPYAVAAKRHGATTVAATMICAHLAGIRVFATGGIGGVHQGVESTMDISADLDELARTPVAVICAGAKAILDLPRTLEYLETRGVPGRRLPDRPFSRLLEPDERACRSAAPRQPGRDGRPDPHQGGPGARRRRSRRQSRAQRR